MTTVINILKMEIEQKLPHWLSPEGKGKKTDAEIREGIRRRRREDQRRERRESQKERRP